MSIRETECDNFLEFCDKVVKYKKLKSDWGIKQTFKKLVNEALKIYTTPIYKDEGYVPVPGVIRNMRTDKTAIAILILNTNNNYDLKGITILTPSGAIAPQDCNKNPEADRIFEELSDFSYWYAPWIPSDQHVHWSDCPESVMSLFFATKFKDTLDKMYNSKRIDWVE